MDHAGTLAHAAQVNGHGAHAILRRQFEGYGKFLVDSIGGHDGPAGCGARLLRVGKGGSHDGNACGDFIKRNVRSDDAGGTDQHRRSGNIEDLSGSFSGFPAQIQAGFSSGGVGDSRIDDHRLRRTAG